MISASKPLPAAPPDDAVSPEALQVQVHLRKIRLLSDLTDAEMARVQREIRIRQYGKREVVLHKGGSGDGLLFLLSGQLQVIDEHSETLAGHPAVVPLPAPACAPLLWWHRRCRRGPADHPTGAGAG